jgi:CubicO group peptidase (beta-lactamase class C family)
MTVTAAPTRLDLALAQVEDALAREHVPGVELAVVHGKEVPFVGGLGMRGVMDPAPVTPTTLFHHGSCGKAFTGFLGALLEADGVLDLDSPVRRYVPELRLPDPFVADRVTIRDLLSHRGGLGRHDLVWILEPGLPAEDLVGRLEHLPLAGDLRAQCSYSNFGFALAGLAMGRAAGSSWAAELERRVLQPLGMSRTAVAPAGGPADGDRATPHVVRDGAAQPTSYRFLGAVAPAGGIVSCAQDSVSWLRAHLGDGPLDPEVVRRTHQAQMLMPAGTLDLEGLELIGYGFGWVSGRYRGHRLVWHNGGVDGFGTQTLLLPDQRIGVVASANVFPTNLPLAVVLSVADALLAVEDPRPWFDLLGPSADPAAAGGAPPAQPAVPASRPTADYCGRFRHGGYGLLEIEAEPGELRARLGTADLSARHRGHETWNLHYEPLSVDLTVTFLPGADGTVRAAEVQFEGEQPVVFVREQAE